MVRLSFLSWLVLMYLLRWCRLWFRWYFCSELKRLEVLVMKLFFRLVLKYSLGNLLVR